MYSYLPLLKERQTMLGERERGGWPPPPWRTLFLSDSSTRNTDKARTEMPTPAWGPTLLSAPSERKTDRARRETRGWLNPTLGVLYSFLPLLKEI